MVRLKGRVPLLFFREGKSYVAYSPALDLSSCGKTYDEALENIKEATDILLEECEAMGTLAEVLKSCGWRKLPRNVWEPPVFIGEQSVEFHPTATACA